MTLKELENYCRYMHEIKGISGDSTVWMLIEPPEKSVAIPYRVGNIIVMRGCEAVNGQVDIPVIMPDLDEPPMYEL